MAARQGFTVLQRVRTWWCVAAWISDTPVSKVSRFCNADMRLCDCAELPKPDNSFVGLPLDSIERARKPFAKNIESSRQRNNDGKSCRHRWIESCPLFFPLTRSESITARARPSASAPAGLRARKDFVGGWPGLAASGRGWWAGPGVPTLASTARLLLI